MKKIVIILLSIISQIGSAQEYKKLPDSYFINREGSGNDIDANSIRNYLNYDLFLMRNSDSIQQLSNIEKSNFYAKMDKSEIVNLKKGNYYIDNKDNYFKFIIDKNGILNGEAQRIVHGKRSYERNIVFLNGVIVSQMTVNLQTNKIDSKGEFKDSIFTEELYDKNGILVTRGSTNYKLGGGQSNYISTHYYENGKVSSEQNNIDKTFMAYYENGSIKRHTDDKNKFGKDYDENGVLESQYYKKGSESCQESYSNGIISSKKCSNEKESKEYFYENGKMTDYEIYDLKTGERRVFDSNDKLKPGKKIPRVSIGS